MRNPIREIIPDDVFATLARLNLLNKKVLRDFQIKKHYLILRDSGMKSNDAIEHILQAYPYLQFDTVRKIIYSVKLPKEIDHNPLA